jgi:hypothetical protein
VGKLHLLVFCSEDITKQVANHGEKTLDPDPQQLAAQQSEQLIVGGPL